MNETLLQPGTWGSPGIPLLVTGPMAYRPQNTVNEKNESVNLRKKEANFIHAKLKIITQEADFQKKALITLPPARSRKHSRRCF